MRKPWWKSKTLWFNLFGAAAVLGDQLAGAGVIDGETAATVSIVGNTALRFFTDTSIR